MKPVKLLSLLDVLQFENTHRKRTILGVVELSGCWGFGFVFFFFARQLFLSQGPTIPSWNRLLWANLPSPHPPSKAASDSDSNNSQHEDILTALSSAAQKQAGDPCPHPSTATCPQVSPQAPPRSFLLPVAVQTHPRGCSIPHTELSFPSLSKRKTPKAWENLHQAKDKSPREEEEPPTAQPLCG